MTAAIVRRDSPLGRLHDAEADVLAVGNRDVVDWQGVEVALTGVVVAADGRRHATGRYVGDASREVPRGGQVAFILREFTNSRGGRWAALTMRATSVEVTLRRAGVACRGQVVVTGG